MVCKAHDTHLDRFVAIKAVPAERVADPSTAWSGDGRCVIVPNRDSPEQPLALYLFSAESGERRKLTSPAATEGDRSPALFPDGRTVLNTQHDFRGADPVLVENFR